MFIYLSLKYKPKVCSRKTFKKSIHFKNHKKFSEFNTLTFHIADYILPKYDSLL